MLWLEQRKAWTQQDANSKLLRPDRTKWAGWRHAAACSPVRSCLGAASHLPACLPARAAASALHRASPACLPDPPRSFAYHDYESLTSLQPFPKPIPLDEVVECLVDAWDENEAY